ncbi:MAG: hypothetical protein J6Q38_06355 [Clostridia bacterium]|nr:hypothetical protein [Clostridia bacterium]
MNSNFKVGYSKAVITPPMGIEIAGYFVERIADGVLDDLEVVSVALSDGKNTVILMTIDHCGLVKEVLTPIREAISEKTGVPADAIFIHSTYTHTGPKVLAETDDVLINEYRVFLMRKCVDVATFSLEDLKPAKMGYAIGRAPNISFIRRYKMKDGSIKTNPGVNNPDIVEPVGEVDERVNVLRFDRENAETVVLVNFGDHPDTIGGNKISGDWPTLTRKFVEKSIDNSQCILFNGAQGDVNHVNVFPKGGDLNGMFMDFDDVSRGYSHAIHMGRVVAGAVMQVYEKVNYVDVNEIRYIQKLVDIPSNKPNPEDLPLAHKYNDLHLAGRDDLIPFKAMMLTTVVAEAGRMVRLENAPDYFPMLFSAVKIGNVALFGIPGEPFNGIGMGLKETEGYDLILPCCITNAYEGYFPMQDSYDEGGYEARSSNFKAGVAEKIIEEGKKILSELKN